MNSIAQGPDRSLLGGAARPHPSPAPVAPVPPAPGGAPTAAPGTPASPPPPGSPCTPGSAICTPVLPPRIRIPFPALDIECGSARYRTAPMELVAERMECGMGNAEPGMPEREEGVNGEWRIEDGRGARGESGVGTTAGAAARPAPSGAIPPFAFRPPPSPIAPLPSAMVHSPSSPPPPPPSLYALRKDQGVWRLTFAGREALLRHERGLLYVAWLLQHPPAQPLHALDLAAQIPALYRAQLGLGAPPPGPARVQERSLALDDAQSLRALRQKEQELEALLDDETESEPVKAEALRELEGLAQFLRQQGHRSRDAAGRAVRTVRQAIKRVHAHAAAAVDAQGAPHPVLRPFAEHLQCYLLVPSSRYLGRGNRFARSGLAGCFTYEPPAGVTWNVRA